MARELEGCAFPLARKSPAPRMTEGRRRHGIVDAKVPRLLLCPPRAMGGGSIRDVLVVLSIAAMLATRCLEVAEGVSMGGDHSCSVFDDGTVKCWGYNNVGQLGLGDIVMRGSSPSDMGDNLPEVDLGEGFVAAGVTCGLDHTCAWSHGGRLKCWGGNAFGQLGYGDTLARGNTTESMGDNLHYIPLGTGHAATFAVAANHFTCVLLEDETIKCFGRADWGQLGSGNATNNVGDGPNEMGDNLPIVKLVAPGANYTASVIAAHNGPCAIMQSDVAVSVALKCWGPNGYGSLGVGDHFNRGDDPDEMEDFLSAAKVGTDLSAVDIVTGMDFVCAIVQDGRVKCWGRNPNGQCGLGDVETYGNDPDEMGDNLPFVDLGTNRTAVKLAAGDAHVCAILNDASVKCWGKGYYGATGHETWHSTGQIPGQMGDNLPTLDLGTSPSSSTSSSSSAGRTRQLRSGEQAPLERRGLQSSSSSSSYGVLSLTAGGQRSCAILDGGVVKCWGRAWAGSLGLGDMVDRGDRSGSMGNNLPTLSLGTGKVAVAPSPAEITTVSPTPAPSLAPTTLPTTMPTKAPTPSPVKATPEPTPSPAAEKKTRAPLSNTPAPTTPAPSAALATARGGFEGLADDAGVTVIQGIVITAGLAVFAIILVCCGGYCLASKRRSQGKSKSGYANSSGTLGGGGAAVGPRKKDVDRSASSQVGAASGHSRASSRVGSGGGSRVNSRAASFYGPDGAESLLSDSQPFYATRGPGTDGENFENAGATPSLSDDRVLYAERRVAQAGAGEEAKADAGEAVDEASGGFNGDGDGGNGHGAGAKSNGHKKNASSASASSFYRGEAAVNGNGFGNGDAYHGDGGGGGDGGTSVASVLGTGVRYDEEKDDGAGSARDWNGGGAGLESSRNGDMLGTARGLKKTFNVTGSSTSTPARMKSAAAALTPSYLRRASSSDTPTHTWSGQYQVQPVEGSGSVTPDSNAADSTFSQKEKDSASTYASHSRNGSAMSGDAVGVSRA